MFGPDYIRLANSIERAIDILQQDAGMYRYHEEPDFLRLVAVLRRHKWEAMSPHEEWQRKIGENTNDKKQTGSIRYDVAEDCVYYIFPDGSSMSLNASDSFYVWLDGRWTWTTLYYDNENGWCLGAEPELDLRSISTLQASVDSVFEVGECTTQEKDKAYYVEKAKRQRGLTDEQIDFFLQNHPRWDLLPYYARYVKKLGMQGALEEVRAQFG